MENVFKIRESCDRNQALFFAKAPYIFAKTKGIRLKRVHITLKKGNGCRFLPIFLPANPAFQSTDSERFGMIAKRRKGWRAEKKERKKLVRKRIAHGQVSYINRTMEAPNAFSKSHSHRQHSLAWLRTERKDSGPSASRHREIAVPGGSDTHFSSCL